MRRLRFIAIAISLVLCLLVAVSWIRSCYIYDSVSYDFSLNARLQARWLNMSAAAGRINIGGGTFFLTRVPQTPLNSGWDGYIRQRPDNPFMMTPYYKSAFAFEFRFTHRDRTPTFVNEVPSWFTDWGMTFPHWVPLLLFAVLPTWQMCRWLRQYRRPAGVCRQCGYDLRASPDRCPECGTPAVPIAKII